MLLSNERKIMTKTLFLTISLLLPAVAGSAAEGAVNLPAPTPQQVAWHEAGVGLFFHWAPNVYQGGEGDNRSTPRDKINPDRFNADQWVQAVKAANAGYMIFVAKHVGGYCAWQTKTTDYSLKTSPWRQGKGDMLAELAKACQTGGIRLGVYLCPRDDTQGAGDGGRTPSPEKQAVYNETYRQELMEILTGYGPMFEMWFDGGNIVPINDLIDQHSPGIISFQGRRAGGSRWVGTEHGFAPYPCWNTIDWKPGETPKEGAGSPTGNTWCPAECDVSILRPNWFWSEGSDKRILSLNDLIEIYYMSVGHGVNLLLNATPDSHGEVPAAQMKRLQEFGDEIRARFAKPLFTTRGEGNNVTLDFGSEQTIDHIILREDIHGGERIRKFLVEGRRADGTWLALARGIQVGSRQIIPIPATAVTGLRFTVQESVAPVAIRELSAFRVNRPVPKLTYRENSTP
jgi:alpha-L-fucosidase